MDYLTEVGEMRDGNGMASTQLAAAVGYPGSSVAFAQLLSGMERSGLIEREVRGKRTYRIRLGPAQSARRAASVGAAGAALGGVAGAGPGGIDYDELARRLLVQVARCMSETGGQVPNEPGEPQASSTEELAEENVRLREQLRLAQRSLAMAAEGVRRLPITADLAGSELVTLQRLLSPWVSADC